MITATMPWGAWARRLYRLGRCLDHYLALRQERRLNACIIHHQARAEWQRQQFYPSSQLPPIR